MNAHLAKLSRQIEAHLPERLVSRRALPRTDPSPVPVAEIAPTPVHTSNPAPGVLEIHLAGGSRRNVLGRSTIARIESLVEFAPESTRVVLITADGPDFCAGYDLLEAAEGGAAAELLAHESNLAVLRRSGRPVIAALSGNVIGGGLELALAADLRIASRDTRLAIPACALGLVYSAAGAQLLVEELGESVARSMLLGGRAISAAEALSMGLVSEIVEPSQLATRGRALASEIAGWSPLATAGNRRLLDAVTGRLSADTAALHEASFVPGGALAGAIAAFAARRQRAPMPSTPTLASVRLRSLGNELLRSGRERGRELGRSLGKLLPSS